LQTPSKDSLGKMSLKLDLKGLAAPGASGDGAASSSTEGGAGAAVKGSTASLFALKV
jgi:hypothetical protein